MGKSPVLTVIATILAAIAVVLIPVTLVAFNLQQHLMDPQTYKDVFAQQELYNRIPGLVARQLTQRLNPPGGKQATDAPAVFLFMDEEDWTLILEEMLDKDWSQRQVEAVIDGVFTLFNGEVEVVQVPISLQELRAALNGPEGERILKIMFGSLPDCTMEDVSDFVTRLIFSGDFELPACSLPDEILDPILREAHALITPAFDRIPDTLQITLSRSNFDISDPALPGHSFNLVDRYQTVQTVIRFGPWTIFTLLVLIALAVVRSWRNLLVWWGWPLFLGGAAIWLPILVSGNLFVLLLEKNIAIRAPRAFSVEVVEMATAIMGQIVREMFIPLRQQSGLLAAAGFILLAAAFYLKRRNESTSASTGLES
jgi:hypothetical protein